MVDDVTQAKMSLTDDQESILKRCANLKSGSIPIQAVKGRRYLLTSDDERPELDCDNPTVKQLFDDGYLQETSKNTCKLTALGKGVVATL